jgi:hypothetical protein
MLARRLPIRRHGASAPGVLASIALVIALMALFLSIFREPLGPVYRMNWHAFSSPLSGYDFSTPAAALQSSMKAEYNRDIRAMMEFTRLSEEKELKERIDTLEIKKEVEVKIPKKPRFSPRALELDRDKPADKKAPDKKPEKMREIKLLFVTYKEDGEPQYKVESLEKHLGSGLWKRTYVSDYELRDVDKALEKEKQEWEAKNDSKDKP